MASRVLLLALLGALVCTIDARKLGSEKGSFRDEKNFFHRPGFGGGVGGGGGGGFGGGGGGGLGGGAGGGFGSEGV